MKRIVITLVGAALAAGVFFLASGPRDSREEYEAFLRTHPYANELKKGFETEKMEEGEKETADPDRPDLAFMQDFLRTMDPALRRPSPELLYTENIRAALLRDRNAALGRTQSTSLADATQWEERGPSLVGGRTRSLLFDPADPAKKKVWAGGVSGGLWYNDDITDINSSWHKVDDFWDNLSVSCIAADPNNTDIMYVGTGEFQSFVRGAGIWKTTNGGESWSRLPNTSEFHEIRDIVVRNEGGNSVVYAAVNPSFGDDNPTYKGGLFRSSDGTNWTQVLPFAQGSGQYINLPTDIEIAADGSIWVGTRAHFWVGGALSTIYHSTIGTASTWTPITNFTAQSLTFSGQIELGLSPTDANTMYAIVEEGNELGGMFKSVNKGVSWTEMTIPVDADLGIPAHDFTRGQAWYDLIIAVSPASPSTVIVGGIDLFKTTDGGATWSQISKWHGGISATAPVVHADQHEVVFRPGFANQVIFGNDGGVYYSSDISASTGSLSISAHNENYNVTQFYTAALHPTQTDYMLGGTQDNGTQKFTESGFGVTSEAFGGDGGMCFIDQLNPNFQICSYVYNHLYLSANGGAFFNTALLEDGGSGNFINVGDYDSHRKALYTGKDGSSVYRIRNVTSTFTVDDLPIPDLGSMASAIHVSERTTAHTNLFVGTEAGRLFKIEQADTESPVIAEITGANFPNGSISGISIGETEAQILVTFFNYGVVSIWETRDGGDNWANREGNLPNMPVRWVEYHPHNKDQAYIATELGVWSTDNINTVSPVWKSTNGGLANVRTDMLQMRSADGVMMASTHGRGVFTALIPSQLAQEITFEALETKVYGDEPFEVEASSSSSLEVTFSSSDPTIASVDGNEVTIHKAGTVDIIADQAGNNYYAPAPSLPRTLIINKAPQTITFNVLPEKTVIDQPFDLTATATSELTVAYASSDPNVASINGNTVTIHGTGTTTITASQAGNGNYLAATNVTRQLTVVSRIIALSGNLDFGDVVVGETATLEMTIQNSGTAPLNVTGITYPAGFTGETEVIGSSIVVTITFEPTQIKEYAGEVTVNSNATSGDNTHAISGVGISITDVENALGSKVQIHPNPADQWIEISGGNFTGMTHVNITDASGNAITRSIEHFSNSVKLPVGDLAKGVYLVPVSVDQKIIYKKFTKK